jgi:outer membrane protein assembly factor BamB
MSRLCAVLSLSFLWSLTMASAEEWPGWRGPRGDGTSTETGVPLKWNDTENVRWKTPIPGTGHSSPIIWGDRVFVTTCLEKDQERMLLCLDRRDGKVLWQVEVLRAKLEGKHRLNSFSSSTPVTDGKHVWVTFLDIPTVRVYCYDFDGKKVWEKSPGEFRSVHGYCSSPILHKNLLILNGDQDAKNSYLVAFDKNTGEEKWRVDRPNHTRSYCVPILIESKSKPGVTQLVMSGSKCVTSYDADTGKLLWINNGPTEQYVASLVFLDETLFLTTGFPEYHLMGIDPGGTGDITKSKYIRWHIPHSENGPKGASYVPSPIAYGHHFFVVSDPGYLGCIESTTGKRLWMERLGKHHSSSPVLVDGYFYFPDDDGVTWVLKAGPEFKVVAQNKLGEGCRASPAVSRGQIFIRTLNHLYCIGSDGKAASKR